MTDLELLQSARIETPSAATSILSRCKTPLHARAAVNGWENEFAGTRDFSCRCVAQAHGIRQTAVKLLASQGKPGQTPSVQILSNPAGGSPVLEPANSQHTARRSCRNQYVVCE